MKKPLLLIIPGVTLLFVIIFLASQRQSTSIHPTLGSSASMPDQYLRNVNYYEEQDRHETSAFNLEKAIHFIAELESDVDEQSFVQLQKSTKRLEQIRSDILAGTVNTLEMRSAFEYALNNLARAELEVAEMYAETNQMDQANIALKYAQLHIKNAMLFHNPFWSGDSVELAIERQVFEEMEALDDDKNVSPVEYIVTLDHMIKEVDEIISQEEANFGQN